MSRRTRRRTVKMPRCNDCKARVRWFGSAVGHGWWLFNADPVKNPRERPLGGYPVENKKAWKFDELVEELMIRHGYLRGDAEDEVYDMPWHTRHACSRAGAEVSE